VPFSVTPEPLLPQHPEWGTASLPPWDEDYFGFRVANLDLCDTATLAAHASDIHRALVDFAAARQVELVGVHLPVLDTPRIGLLSAMGFLFVEHSLRVSISRLQAAAIPAPRLTVRRAEPEDHAAIGDIAGSVFAYARYHTDPRFPVALGHRRYRRWIENALADPDPAVHVYVLGPRGSVHGFFHVVLEDGAADLRLGGVAVESQLGLAGPALYAGVLADLKRQGARSASAKISASNTAVMNIYASLGFRFSAPELVFHWHAPNAPHLLPAGGRS
jgi:hypothetical protein